MDRPKIENYLTDEELIACSLYLGFAEMFVKEGITEGMKDIQLDIRKVKEKFKKYAIDVGNYNKTVKD